MASARGDITQQEFCASLAKLKLLNDDYPQDDERWIRFYAKFVVTDGKSDEPRFSLLHALIALYFLCQSPPDIKAKAVCDLFTDYNVFEEDQSSNIFGLQTSQRKLDYEKRLTDTFLSREQLHCIVSTFVNVSLALLPLYASDFPSADKGNFLRLLVDWNKRRERVVQQFVTEFTGLSKELNPLGRVTVREFIEKAQRVDIFEVLMIRQVAKNTLLAELPRELHYQRDSVGSNQQFNFQAGAR